MPTVLVGHYCDIVSDRSNLREKGIFGSRVQEVTAHNIKGMPWGQWGACGEISQMAGWSQHRVNDRKEQGALAFKDSYPVNNPAPEARHFQVPQTQTPAGDKMFKHLSLWGRGTPHSQISAPATVLGTFYTVISCMK